jgi:hypothetical protein
VDSVLAKYLDRDYWEKRRTASASDTTEVGGIGGYRASAPPPSDSVSSTGVVNAGDGQYGGGGYGGGDSASVVMGGGMRKREPSANSINTMVQAFSDMPMGNGTGPGGKGKLIIRTPFANSLSNQPSFQTSEPTKSRRPSSSAAPCRTRWRRCRTGCARTCCGDAP